MLRKIAYLTFILLVAVASLTAAAVVDLGDSALEGPPPLQSIGPITFGSDGILFVADSAAASVFAIDLGAAASASAGDLAIDGVGEKVAAVLGTTPDQIRIEDLAVHPQSHEVYLSVARGLGPDAEPALVRFDSKGAPGLVNLAEVRYAKAELVDVPTADAKDRRGRGLRQEAITDLAYLDGKLFVTGLSNEEFSSRFRTLDFPFDAVSPGTTVEIYHGSHGRWETNAPIRTMAVYDIGTAPHLLAAYTCTPLVKVPLAELATSKKVTGTTVAELGNRNRPLDMIVYRKGGKDYVLMANSSRGVMKVSLEEITDVAGIRDRIADTAGLEFETLEELEGVVQLDRYGREAAVLLKQSGDDLALQTIALP